MMIKKFAILVAALCMLGIMSRAQAETDKVTIARQFGIGYLSLTVMNTNKLVEKHLAQAGLNDTKVTWARFGSGSAANDALLSGNLDFASGGTGPGIILWDKTHDNYRVHGVAALSSMPNLLVSSDPRIKTIKDFNEKDKISMAGAGSSVQTVYLQMAVSKEWGIENYKKLNSHMVNLPHPEGLNALVSGSGGITSIFTSPPYQYTALDRPGMHVVLNSYDVMGGANTFLMLWGTDTFRKANPNTYKAVLGALKEATQWINDNKQAAAELYIKDIGGKGDVNEIAKMINDPQIHFTLAPERILPYAQFMYKIGTLKHNPTAWTDLFFPEIHDLAGS